MSLFKYGNLEAEIDFTDADFLDRIDEAKQNLKEDMKGIPKTGKAADIVRARVSVSSIFLTVFLEREHTKRCSRVEPASTRA